MSNQTSLISLWFYTYGYAHERTFETIEEAIEEAKKIYFSCSFMRDGNVIGGFCPISGVKLY